MNPQASSSAGAAGASASVPGSESRICPQCGNATSAATCPLDGWSTLPVHRLGGPPSAPTDLVGRWQTGARLAQEGPLTIWGGVDTATGKPVRLTVIALPPQIELGDIARMQRAAKALEDLSHPRIAKVLATGIDARGDLVIVSEHIQGPTLGESLRADGFGPVRTARLGVQLFEALEAAHAAGVMHHDLTPERIRLARDGKGESLILQDIGLADLLRLASRGAEQDPTQLRLVTARYRAPEQSRDRAVTRHADLYAAGAILYEMLCGKPVFDERTAADYLVAHLVKLPERPVVEGRLAEGPLVELILRCLEKKPWHRPDGATEAREALKAIAFAARDPRSAAASPEPLASVILSKALAPPPLPAIPRGDTPDPTATGPVPTDIALRPSGPRAMIRPPTRPFTPAPVVAPPAPPGLAPLPAASAPSAAVEPPKPEPKPAQATAKPEPKPTQATAKPEPKPTQATAKPEPKPASVAPDPLWTPPPGVSTRPEVRVSTPPPARKRRAWPLVAAAIVLLAGGAWAIVSLGRPTTPDTSDVPPLERVASAPEAAPTVAPAMPAPAPTEAAPTAAPTEVAAPPAPTAPVAAPPAPSEIEAPAAPATEAPLELAAVEVARPEPTMRPATAPVATAPVAPIAPTRTATTTPAKAPLAPENVPPKKVLAGEVPPAAAMARAFIVSVPPGADVLVDGHAAGRTPLTVSWETGSETTLQLALEGHDSAYVTLDESRVGKMVRVALVPKRDKTPRAVQLVETPPAEEQPAANPTPTEPPPEGDGSSSESSLLKRHSFAPR